MIVQDIRNVWEALEATAINRNAGNSGRQNASKREVAGLRAQLTRFLEELNGDLSVADLRDALEEYPED